MPDRINTPFGDPRPLSRVRSVVPERVEPDTMQSAAEAASHWRGSINQACGRLPAQYETSDELENEPENATPKGLSQSAYHDLSTSSPGQELPIDTDGTKQESPSSDSINLPLPEHHSEYLQVAIPTFSNGSTTTFGYQQALRNRIFASKIARAGEYDPGKYTPTFVHDCLMLPGSLASTLRKTSSADIVQRMTPTLLPGFTIEKDSIDGQPCLVQSDNRTDYAQGMLVLGQGKSGRDFIHAHYRCTARRTKVQVQIDVVAVVPWHERVSALERWRLVRHKIMAYAWVTSKVYSVGIPWSLEEWLDRESDEVEELLIDPSAYGIEEDGGVDVKCHAADGMLGEMQEVVREIRRGRCGSLDYERVSQGWGGW